MLRKSNHKDAVYMLPDYFVEGELPSVYCKHYIAGADSIKSRIVYNTFMVGFLVKGEKEVFVGSRHEIINENSILLLQNGSVLMSQRMLKHESFESILFFFDQRFLYRFMEKYQPNVSTIHEAQPLFVLPKDVYLQQFQKSILHLQADPSDPMVQVKLEELMLYLLKTNATQMAAFLKQAMGGSAQQKVHQLIMQSLDKNLSVEELAFLCNMSISTFKRVFQDLYKTSPKKYFTERKMDRAKQFLMQKGRISEIYSLLGYESLAAFSTEFKKQFGVSPKQFQTKFESKHKVSEL